MTTARAAAVLVGTGVLSLSSVWQTLDPRATLALPLGTAAYLAFVVAGALGLRGRAGALPAKVLLGVAATALWAPIALVLAAGHLPLSTALFAVAALVLALALARADAGDGRRAALGVAAVAVMAAVALRHVVVASNVLLPDDVVAPFAVGALTLLAVTRGTAHRSALALAAVLGSYALAALGYIVAVPYHVDAVAIVHRAAELAVAGSDPYRSLDAVEALARFGLPSALATNFEDGTVLRSLNYPALSFLLPAPLVALGLGDLRPFYLAELVALALVVAATLPQALRPLAPAAIAGSDQVTRQHVLAGVDPTWALLGTLSVVALDRRWVSALALGLAAASRQQAWLIAPFYLLAVRARWGGREALRRAALAAAAFALPNLPYLAGDAGAWTSGVTAPVLAALEPHGVGLVRLGLEGALPLLPRIAYAALALTLLAALLVLAARRRLPRAAALVLPLVPLYLAWRSLVSYFALLGPLGLVGPGGSRAAGADATYSPADAGRQRAARDTGLPGRPRGRA